MDGHALIGRIAIFSCITGDGGPRGFHRRHKPLPEKYLPGRFLADLQPELRADVVRTVNSPMTPATWFLRQIVEAEAEEARPQMPLPPPPVDRRWCRHGRWSMGHNMKAPG